MSDDRTVMRRALDAGLPEGSAWKVEPDGGMDKYLDGFAADLEIPRVKMLEVSNTRNPSKTSNLSDLELDFSIIPDETISIASRRQYLLSRKGSRGFIPSWEKLEAKLREAGYLVRVYPNDPPIDPATIFFDVPLATVGDGESTVGNPESRIGYTSSIGAELLINGDSAIFQEKDYQSTVCNDDSGETTVCDDTEATPVEDRGDTCGAFAGMIRENYSYPLPTKWYRFPFIFWICGSKINPTFKDFNFEYATNPYWTEESGAIVTKTRECKTRGIRGLKVAADTGWSDPIGPYSEQILDTPFEGSLTVSVDVCSVTSLRLAGLMISDKDGVWDTVGIVYASGASTIEYVATNGVSAARLYIANTPVVGDYAIFDQILIDGPTFTKADIPLSQRDRFENMVLKYKPVRAWAATIINWTEDAGLLLEDDMAYRFVQTTVGGTLNVVDSEVAVHIILYGTSAGFTVRFADATTFSERRLYRLTNQSSEPITVRNYDGSITDDLLPLNVMQCTVSDIASVAGDWNLVQHIAGPGEVV